MTASAKEDKRWRWVLDNIFLSLFYLSPHFSHYYHWYGPFLSDYKKMEEDDSLRTLDCLRGRLLAERQASKVAKEEAQLMGNKVCSCVL